AVFFDNVAHLPRIVNITDVAIKGGENKGGDDTLTADCSMKIYMFLEKTEETNGQQGTPKK
nr:type 4a pilus biogenesis protein PilO [Syntrophales bacterium]